MAPLPHEISEDVAQPVAWAGGDCPLPAQTLVQIQCVFEAEFDYSQPPRRAGAWERRWNRDHGDLCGITHYIVVEPVGRGAKASI